MCAILANVEETHKMLMISVNKNKNLKYSRQHRPVIDGGVRVNSRAEIRLELGHKGMW